MITYGRLHRSLCLLLVRLGLFTALFAFTAVPAVAQDIGLTNVSLQHQAGNLMLHFTIDVKGPDNLRNLLLDGASLVLECEALLMEPRSYWFNEDISKTTMTSSLRSDSLTREFLLTLPGEPERKSKKLDKLLEHGWQALTMNLGPSNQLTRGEQYIVELSAAVTFSDVPPWMKQTLFFWSWEAAPETTYLLEFTY